jgi:hypothetical protein
MDNTANIENTEKGSLLKEKKPRPPQSEKQKEAFKKAREILVEKNKQKKEAKILDAKRQLLEKEGYVKQPPKNETIQFKIDENDESDDDKQNIKEIQKEKPKKPTKEKTPLIKEEKKKVMPKKQNKEYVGTKVETDDDDDDDDQNSDSSEEIVIIKRTKKNKKSQPKIRRTKSYDEDEDEPYQESVATLPNYNNYFL